VGCNPILEAGTSFSHLTEMIFLGCSFLSANLIIPSIVAHILVKLQEETVSPSDMHRNQYGNI
jgi:hypothetical protein